MEIEYYWCKEIFVNNNLWFNSDVFISANTVNFLLFFCAVFPR